MRRTGVRYLKLFLPRGESVPSKNRYVLLHDPRIIGGITILLGLLYIPAFMYGFFILFLIVMYVMSMNEFIAVRYTIDVLIAFCVVISSGPVLLLGLINKVLSARLRSINWRRKK